MNEEQIRKRSIEVCEQLKKTLSKHCKENEDVQVMNLGVQRFVAGFLGAIAATHEDEEEAMNLVVSYCYTLSKNAMHNRDKRLIEKERNGHFYA